jgi:hypothetical protein
VTLLATPSLAGTLASTNLRSNLQSLGKIQPDLLPWVADETVDAEWVFARDRSLTARKDGAWWSGCSVPSSAASRMLAKLEIKGAVGCFLCPPHASHITYALDTLRTEQAIIAVVPELQDLAVILHCSDFSNAFDRHRLWFAAGPAWEIELRRVFDQHPGLATPTQFIRTPDADPQQIESSIAAAQRVFADVNTDRNIRLTELSHSPACSDRRRVCVVAPSQFRLWNDLKPMMHSAFEGATGLQADPLDSDDPCNSSLLALQMATRRCGAVFTANTGRSDLPNLVPDSTTWVSWITGSRIPSGALRSDADQLIVLTAPLRDRAIRMGWPASHVHVAGFPAVPAPSRDNAQYLGIVVDTVSLETPKDLYDFSSHALLWEGIRHELRQDPFVLTDPSRFLADRMKKLGIAEDGFPLTRFVERLMMPAYQQAIARLLIAAKLPVRLYGRGWDGLDEFRSCAGGVIATREAFQEALKSCKALAHVWPGAAAHPIECMGISLIRTAGSRPDGLVAQAAKALQSPPSTAASPVPPLSSELLSRLLFGQ